MRSRSRCEGGSVYTAPLARPSPRWKRQGWRRVHSCAVVHAAQVVAAALPPAHRPQRPIPLLPLHPKLCIALLPPAYVPCMGPHGSRTCGPCTLALI